MFAKLLTLFGSAWPWTERAGRCGDALKNLGRLRLRPRRFAEDASFSDTLLIFRIRIHISHSTQIKLKKNAISVTHVTSSKCLEDTVVQFYVEAINVATLNSSLLRVFFTLLVLLQTWKVDATDVSVSKLIRVTYAC